jgi:DNA-directed RNA polymerase subunit RPC12/RpoP
MKCPSCDSKIGMMKWGKFTVGLALRKAMPCPYCNANIYRLTNPTWEYFKLIIFVTFWIGFVLFLIALIFGRVLGYDSALIICFWFWILDPLDPCLRQASLGPSSPTKLEKNRFFR